MPQLNDALDQPHPITHAPGRTTSFTLFFILLCALAVTVLATVVNLKLSALYNWRYTSDLFVIDTMLQETLRGRFMMEYTYGCQFGDHACLILLLGIPIKALLARHMVVFLVMVSPALLLLSSAILFTATRAIAGTGWALFATFCYFLSVGVIHGPFEFTWGFHIDTGSGFVAVAMAALFLCRDEAHSVAWASRPCTSPPRSNLLTNTSLTTVAFYALMKEEMALLGAFFFAFLLLFKRDRLHIASLILCILIFATEILVTRLCRTPWNRTNEALVRDLLTFFREQGITGFLFSREKAQYWLVIIGMIVAMAGCIYAARRFNRFALGLFLIGLAKHAFAWSSKDFDLWAWHNYPALVMLTGGIILQSLELRHLNLSADTMRLRLTTAALVVASLIWFLSMEIPYALQQHQRNVLAYQRAIPYKPAMRDLQKRIDKSKVISVPLYSLVEWTDGYRYGFFPGGITWNVMGVADYAVSLRTEGPEELPQLEVFRLLYQNSRYRLWVRKGYLPGELESRQKFIQLFGPDSIGQHPRPKTNKKKRKHAPASSVAWASRPCALLMHGRDAHATQLTQRAGS